MTEDLRAFGAPESEIERWRNELQQDEMTDVIELPLDCVRIMELFWSVETQWQISVAGTRVVYRGLHYPGVDVAIERLALHTTPEEFALLQVMEGEVIAAIAERR